MADDVKINKPSVTVRTPEYKVIYTNAASTAMSPWDLSITVGQVSNESTINEIATIVMSPQHAKVLLRHWAANVERYEQIFGEISDPMPILEKLQPQ